MTIMTLLKMGLQWRELKLKLFTKNKNTAKNLLLTFCLITSFIPNSVFGSQIEDWSTEKSISGSVIVPNWQDVFAFLLLMAVLLIRPWGLFGKPEQEGH